VIKLSVNILAGSRVLSAVGTLPPHSGIIDYRQKAKSGDWADAWGRHEPSCLAAISTDLMNAAIASGSEGTTPSRSIFPVRSTMQIAVSFNDTCLIELLERVGAKGCHEFPEHRLRVLFRQGTKDASQSRPMALSSANMLSFRHYRSPLCWYTPSAVDIDDAAADFPGREAFQANRTAG
jgi:hypothetical protein